ncbi:CRP-like cAMP-binding protein [Sphingopyxis sp. OAS728]|uniref:Crp/Fnr family transcriptional regulator n=1 Tax=Sphingopyxis sp. OAS728 TaxID=2663823 RepID=UPI0017895642|nr:Crp/Fnr family transcriptional regulator [Sphingopyxis sp. OAS728]MBE1529446.1 CRP-like cAMP-binding protein [Sphingopyxis sp. OAS728]
MNTPSPSPFETRVVSRLGALAPLDTHEWEALAEAQLVRHRVAAHRNIIEEGARVTSPRIILAGWAGRTRIFADGRRQILSLLLPGDLIGKCRQSHPLAATGAVALTDVTLCPAPDSRHAKHGLAEAYARSSALEEYYLFRQIARLGRMSAYERIVDLLLEVRERLGAVALGPKDSFHFPITQEALADLLGLTSVHVNRTLKALRQDGLIDLRSSTMHIKDPAVLAALVEHRPAAVFEN